MGTPEFGVFKVGSLFSGPLFGIQRKTGGPRNPRTHPHPPISGPPAAQESAEKRGKTEGKPGGRSWGVGIRTPLGCTGESVSARLFFLAALVLTLCLGCSITGRPSASPGRISGADRLLMSYTILYHTTLYYSIICYIIPYYIRLDCTIL